MIMFLKKFIPKTLFGRFLLIIVIPTIIVQIIAVYIFYYTHIDRNSKYMARSLLGEIKFINESINNNIDLEYIKLFANNVDISFSFNRDENLIDVAKIADKNYKPPMAFGVINILRIFDSFYRFKIEMNRSGLTPFAFYKDKNNKNKIIIKIAVSGGGIATFNVLKSRITNSSKTVFVVWFLFTSFLTMFISIVFLKNQVRSIKGLALASEKFGRGQEAPEFRPSGSDEIRSVGISFLKMKERLSRQISQRTDMLSGVSHDLRTPLTRMKLQLELMTNNDHIKDLQSDIIDMERMISEYLEFAKGGQKEKAQEVNMYKFLYKNINYYSRVKKNIIEEIQIPEDLILLVKKNSLKRALRNLIDNGFSHGDKVVVTADLRNNYLQIIVEDNGPGVEKSELNNIFKPFYRIDNSRNLDKIGTGLGLSIVLDVISSHGGKVEASKSSIGGLKITINIPK